MKNDKKTYQFFLKMSAHAWPFKAQVSRNLHAHYSVKNITYMAKEFLSFPSCGVQFVHAKSISIARGMRTGRLDIKVQDIMVFQADQACLLVINHL